MNIFNGFWPALSSKLAIVSKIWGRYGKVLDSEGIYVKTWSVLTQNSKVIPTLRILDMGDPCTHYHRPGG